MEIRTITTFLRVAELESFSEAARQLGYSQSAVTVQIKQLEEELQTELFERIGKQVRLTENGLRFIPRAHRILEAVKDAKSLVQNPEVPTGSLRIGTAESLLNSVLPPIIMEFSRRCPQVRLSTCTGATAELFQMVRRNEVDLLYFLDQKTDFPEWIKVGERCEPAYFVASCRHPLAPKRQIPLERLLKEPCVLTEKGISYRYAVDQVLAAKGFAFSPFLETGNTDLIRNILRDHKSISFLPGFVLEKDIKEGHLCVLDVRCPRIQMWSQLVYHRNKWVTPQMEIFVDLMKKTWKQ